MLTLTPAQLTHLTHGLPLLSLHVPFYNEETTILPLLDSIAAQTLPRKYIEVIVVDNNSTDATVPIVQEFMKTHPDITLHIVNEPTQGVQYARKTGLDTGVAHKALILAATDSDAILSPNHLENILQTLNETGADGFSGILEYQEPIKKAYPWFQDYWTLHNLAKRLFAQYWGEKFNGNSYALTTTSYVAIGGQPIHPDWPAGEDAALGEALIDHGFRIVFSEKSPVYMSDRRIEFDNPDRKESHIPISAGGEGFQPVRVAQKTYPPLTPDAIQSVFTGALGSSIKRFLRKVVEQHMTDGHKVSQEQYQLILDTFNNGQDFTLDAPLGSGDFWVEAKQLREKYKKQLWRVYYQLIKRENSVFIERLEKDGYLVVI